MKTITFYSYKGGVGRTLALANVAKYLARFGQKVVVMDFDLEAPGLHYKFGLQHKSEKPLQGVVDILHTFVSQGKLPASLNDFMYEVNIDKTPKRGSIHLLPAGDAPTGAYWRKLAVINWHTLFYAEPAPPGIPLFEELRLWIQHDYAPDFLLIDSRTGITEIGGVAATVMADMVVCLLINNPENLEGVRAIMRSIRKAPRLEDREAVEILPVLTRIPKDADVSIENKILDHVRLVLNEEAYELADTLNVQEIYILHSEPSLQIQEVLAMDGDAKPENSPLLQDYLRLFSRMIPRKTIEPYLEELITEIKLLYFDDPDEAQKKMEALVNFSNHPLAYRSLLKLFEIGRTNPKIVAHFADRYLSLTSNPDDELQKDFLLYCISPLELGP
ncbi:MAG: AAA family ATPase [Magnetococcus sp. DMHC-1]|nr:AAA family ATPase [Magnetococcales bacterium]